MQEKMPEKFVNSPDESNPFVEEKPKPVYKLPYGKKHKKRRMRKVRRNKV